MLGFSLVVCVGGGDDDRFGGGVDSFILIVWDLVLGCRRRGGYAPDGRSAAFTHSSILLANSSFLVGTEVVPWLR